MALATKLQREGLERIPAAPETALDSPEMREWARSAIAAMDRNVNRCLALLDETGKRRLYEPIRGSDPRPPLAFGLIVALLGLRLWWAPTGSSLWHLAEVILGVSGGVMLLNSLSENARTLWDRMRHGDFWGD